MLARSRFLHNSPHPSSFLSSFTSLGSASQKSYPLQLKTRVFCTKSEDSSSCKSSEAPERKTSYLHRSFSKLKYSFQTQPKSSLIALAVLEMVSIYGIKLFLEMGAMEFSVELALAYGLNRFFRYTRLPLDGYLATVLTKWIPESKFAVISPFKPDVQSFKSYIISTGESAKVFFQYTKEFFRKAKVFFLESKFAVVLRPLELCLALLKKIFPKPKDIENHLLPFIICRRYTSFFFIGFFYCALKIADLQPLLNYLHLSNLWNETTGRWAAAAIASAIVFPVTLLCSPMLATQLHRIGTFILKAFPKFRK